MMLRVALLAVAMWLGRADDQCKLLGNDNCFDCTARNKEGGPTYCGWCVPLLECVSTTPGNNVSCPSPPGNTKQPNLVDNQWKCAEQDATPTLYASSLATGPTGGEFGLTMEGINFGILWRNGTEPADSRRPLVMRLGPFNCSASHQSDVVLNYAHDQNDPSQLVNCSALPGIGQHLAACAEARGSDLCNPCGVDPEAGYKSTCPDWLIPNRSQPTLHEPLNPRFSYEPPKISNLTKHCIGQDERVCMIKPGSLISLIGSGFPLNQSIVDVFDTPVLTPRGQTAWDPRGKSGLRVSLGSSWPHVFNCSSYPNVSSGLVSCVVGPGSGTNLSLMLEVGGATVSSGAFGYFQYQPPHINTVRPANGPSYGGQNLTITGSGFGARAADAKVTLSDVSSRRGAGRPVVLTPVWLNDSLMVVVPPASHSNSGVSWKVSLEVGNQTADDSAMYKQLGCNASCTMPGAANHSCQPAGICRCGGVSNFSSSAGQCVCSEHDPTGLCVHGAKNCATNQCDCHQEWSKTVSPTDPYLQVCNLCAVSCSGLDKKVTGGSDCHCTFNTIHLIWIIGAPLLLCLVAVVAYRRRKQPQPDEPLLHKPDEEEQLVQ